MTRGGGGGGEGEGVPSQPIFHPICMFTSIRMDFDCKTGGFLFFNCFADDE